MNIEINEINYNNWGRCIRLSDGVRELFITLDFGPRIIKFCEIGQENMFFEDINDQINSKQDEEILYNTYGKNMGIWHIRGGHRLWLSPEESPKTNYPDNEKVAWEKIDNGIRLIPPYQKVIEVQLEIEITMPDINCVHIVHKIKNVGKKPITLAPWAVTVLSQGGTEIIPVPVRDTGCLENRHISLWPYTKMSDKRVSWGDKYITLKQDTKEGKPFKIGQLSQHGWAAYFNHQDVFIKYFDVNEDKNHPDRNCNFETYTSDLILEMETIGELKELLPNETISHSECWSYYSNVKIPESEDEMDLFKKEYVKQKKIN